MLGYKGYKQLCFFAAVNKAVMFSNDYISFVKKRNTIHKHSLSTSCALFMVFQNDFFFYLYMYKIQDGVSSLP